MFETSRHNKIFLIQTISPYSGICNRKIISTKMKGPNNKKGWSWLCEFLLPVEGPQAMSAPTPWCVQVVRSEVEGGHQARKADMVVVCWPCAPHPRERQGTKPSLLLPMPRGCRTCCKISHSIRTYVSKIEQEPYKCGCKYHHELLESSSWILHPGSFELFLCHCRWRCFWACNARDTCEQTGEDDVFYIFNFFTYWLKIKESTYFYPIHKD